MEYGQVWDVFYYLSYFYFIGLLNVVFCFDVEGEFFMIILGNLFNLLCLLKGCLFQFCCQYVMESCSIVLVLEYFGDGCLCVCYKLVGELV